MSDIVTIISTLGFPIVVTLWFMVRVEKIIGDNTKALIALKDMIENLCK